MQRTLSTVKYTSSALARVLSNLRPTQDFLRLFDLRVPLPSHKSQSQTHRQTHLPVTHKMLLFTAATLTLFAGSTVQAVTFTVDVGAGGNVFTPASVSNAATGDTIIFTLYVGKFYHIISYHITPWPDLVCSKGGNHTVTQSTFASPCIALSEGQDSGQCVPITYSLRPYSQAPPRPPIP